ncbi:MAG: sugar transferase [Yaniella sp.]|uniref:sugar transferase n=1 Tax=Yaniella sp. TaxID=2773929 RepID=UPI003F95FE24
MNNYADKFNRLNRRMRWEVADELRIAYLAQANARHETVQPVDSFYTRYGKRALDLAISSVALVVTSPVVIVALGATLATSGRPAIFKQQRLGRDGKEFTLVKLRTMRDEYDDDGRPLPGALRVTKVGRLIRRTSIDELLNFWNIFFGDMSIIGPRPLVPEYYGRFSDRHLQRMAAKPGLNCPALRPNDRLGDYEQQFENDVEYVASISFLGDLKLMVRTFRDIFDRDATRTRAASERGSFMGYDEFGRVVTSDSIPSWAIDRVLARNGLLK